MYAQPWNRIDNKLAGSSLYLAVSLVRSRKFPVLQLVELKSTAWQPTLNVSRNSIGELLSDITEAELAYIPNSR
jgi:hypothetical protein